MWVTKTPLRVSLAGGGTDLPAYYEERDFGAVISFALAKHIYICSEAYHDASRTRFQYSKTETVGSCKDFENPIVKEVLSYLKLGNGFQFASISNVPGGTGLGSSSAFCVALLSNVAALLGRPLSQLAAADLACHVEIDRLGEPIGKQDQYGCALGGIKKIEFTKDSVGVTNVPLPSDVISQLQNHFVLVRVGKVRSASRILQEVQRGGDVNFASLDEIRAHVPIMESFLASGDVEMIGRLLDENWKLKKSLSKRVANEEIDELYDLFVPRYAYGGKLLGAGGSGFLLFVLREKHGDWIPESIAGGIEGVRIDQVGVSSWEM